MVKRITQIKKFPTKRKALSAAHRVNGAMTQAKLLDEGKAGYVAYTLKRKKIRGWKRKSIEF